MIRRNWKSWLLAIPAWTLGIVIGFVPGAIFNYFRRRPSSYNFLIPDNLASAAREEIPFYLMYTLAGLALVLVIYLAHRLEIKWTPAKIAFMLGFYTFPTLLILFLKNFGGFPF